jgi:hypothetical protein
VRTLAGQEQPLLALAREGPGWTTLDAVLGPAFPVSDPADLAGLLDTPWGTLGRLFSALALSGPDVSPRTRLAEQGIAAGDERLLRIALRSPVRDISPDVAVRALDAPHALGGLDSVTIEVALLNGASLARAVLGLPLRDGGQATQSASCAGLVLEVLNGLIIRLTRPGQPWEERLPVGLPRRGLRIVQHALGLPADSPVAAILGAADLTPQDWDGLIAWLAGQPGGMRRRAFRLRLSAGDADAILPLLDLDGAGPLLAIIRGTAGEPEVTRQDRAEILAAAALAGRDRAQRLLKLCPGEIVAAALGLNRPAVLKRVRHNALWGIAAYGMLPLDDRETLQDRYVALREIAKRGPRLGPNRRHSHARAIDAALDHLAQVAGFPDATALEWECEARIASGAPPVAPAGEYTLALAMRNADPVITVTRAGKELRSVPAAVRADPSYAALREHQELLRDQARRMRAGLLERLVATSGTLSPGDLSRLRVLPCGGPLLAGLLWQDQAGTIGLLDGVDATGPLTAVHPHVLYERGELAAWQERIVRQRLRQPVKQAFRELYVLTPAERDTGDVSARFAGHVLNGKVAGQLLTGRGWTLHGPYDDFQATRLAGPGLTAALRCDFHGYFGLDNVTTGEVRFLTAGRPVPLASVPPAAFSEAMRDLDLMVSVASTDPSGYASPASAGSRAQILASLVSDLGLDRVTIDGTTAVVRGSRATYRVNLTSGSIHLVPGGYLCIVPASFGRSPHRRLFLPFSGDDQPTSAILSKVLLLAEDEKITDRSILAQIPTTQPPAS